MCIPSQKVTVHVQFKILKTDLIFQNNEAHHLDHDTMPHQFTPKNKFRWAGHRVSDLVWLSFTNKKSKTLKYVPPLEQTAQKAIRMYVRMSKTQ